MMSYSTPEEWFEGASKRPQGVSDQVIGNRMKVALLMREGSAEAGFPVTQDMIDAEMLLITGRMKRSEFNSYLQFKEENGGLK